jgi:hypothetical protein
VQDLLRCAKHLFVEAMHGSENFRLLRSGAPLPPLVGASVSWGIFINVRPLLNGLTCDWLGEQLASPEMRKVVAWSRWANFSSG